MRTNDARHEAPEQPTETTSVFSPVGRESGGTGPTAGDLTEGASASTAVDELPAGSALLVVKRGPNAGSRFLLDRDTTGCGRHPDSNIFLDDVTVSRTHAELRRDGSDFVVSDLGSLNGTYLNRSPIETALLANGDEIQIGKFRLVFLTGSTR